MTRAPQRNAYKRAAKSIEQSRIVVETIISQTPNEDHFTLGLLGPILAELRTAQATIERLAPQNNA